MFSVFFSAKEVLNYDDSANANQEAFRLYFMSMLEQGIYLAPSQFETCFVSGAHTEEEIERTIAAAQVAMQEAASAMK
jgi:glutamate-1-semialdehyde 2,1-aminomutase